MPTPKQEYINSLKGKGIVITKKGSNGAIVIQKKPTRRVNPRRVA